MSIASQNLIAAVEDAMTDALSGDPRPHYPAILRDRTTGVEYYGSVLQAECGDTLVVDLSNGFGTWTPADDEDIPDAAASYAQAITDEGFCESA